MVTVPSSGWETSLHIVDQSFNSLKPEDSYLHLPCCDNKTYTVPGPSQDVDMLTPSFTRVFL